MRVLLQQRVPRSRYTSGLFPADCEPSDITAEELKRARAGGEAYGGDFVPPVTITVLCQTLRDSYYWRRGKAVRVFDLIVGVRTDLIIPVDWQQDPTIMERIVYMNAFGDVEQTINLMRALIEHGRKEGKSTKPETKDSTKDSVFGRRVDGVVQPKASIRGAEKTRRK